MVASAGIIVQEFQSVALRTNFCPNPGCKHNVTGWNASSAAFTQITGVTGMSRTTALKWTGNGFVQTPTGDCDEGDVIAVSFEIQNNVGFSHAGGRQVFVGFPLDGGGTDFSQSFNTPALGPDGNTVRGEYVTSPAPSGANGVFLIVDSLNGEFANGFYLTAVLYEKVGAVDTYIDGDSPGGTWLGADGNSVSTAP